jgi:allantoate deiminase
MWDDAELALTDSAGVPLADAVAAMGGDPARIAAGARPDALLAWCEVHIEQGTRLERAGVPLGVVTAIQGQTRCTATFRGQAGHAGTTAMEGRRDALLAAAEWALAVEAEARAIEGLVATVGRLDVAPGAPNVIPGEAVATLDARHPDDGARRQAVAALAAFAEDVAQNRGVTVEWRQDTDNPSVAFSPRLQGLLAQAVEETAGSPVPRLASGAGHDASPLSRITEVSMLFVRCRDGISHNPAEHVDTPDVAAAAAALDRFVALLAAATPGPGPAAAGPTRR